MTRKPTFFRITYFTVSRFLYFGLLGLVFSNLIELIERNNDKSHFPFLKTFLLNLNSKISEFGHVLKLLSMLFLIIATLLIILEIINRLISDSIWNFFKSVYQTIRLHRFLLQEEQSKSIASMNSHQKIERFNPILNTFNSAISRCTVDVRNDSVTVIIKYPKSQQAQSLLRKMESLIKEEISNNNPNFFFSSAFRVRNKLIFKATRR
ncbi:hypothetical protein [Lactococcus garvieae]|uniref:hypothetical protein n=1 Tax=Lactococcus garvieae TaxID=1363 RepID=UPI0022E2B1B6|nr:hypothetical protein [Lactococcus garvieae]